MGAKQKNPGVDRGFFLPNENKCTALAVRDFRDIKSVIFN